MFNVPKHLLVALHSTLLASSIGLLYKFQMLLFKDKHRIFGFVHIPPSFGRNPSEFSLIPSDSIQITRCILVLLNVHSLCKFKGLFVVGTELQIYLLLENHELRVFPFLESVLLITELEVVR